jgi:dienelactone hydrolase
MTPGNFLSIPVADLFNWPLYPWNRDMHQPSFNPPGMTGHYGAFTLCVACGIALAVASANAQRLRLTDGRMLEGRVNKTTGVADSPSQSSGASGDIQAKLIYIIDDDLRRIFIPKSQVAEVLDSASAPLVKIEVWQNINLSGRMVSSVGPSLGITPFDEFGRRVYHMRTSDGPLAVVQGVTELTPRYCKVEGLRGAPGAVVWDMRIATSSLPRATMSAILAKAVPRGDQESRLQVVRFYMQAERYRDARRELEAIRAEFPKMQDMRNQVRQLRQMQAQRLLQEIELRKEAGQHRLTKAFLENFPADEVAGETLQHVRELIADYAQEEQRIDQIRKRLQMIIDQIADPRDREIVQPIVTEITSHLSYNNVGRLAPFVQLSDDGSLSADQKGALAISGWLMGSNDATEDLAVAVSMVQARAAVREYLREPLAHKRSILLDSMSSIEGASVENVAKMIARMAPPWALDSQGLQGAGYYKLIASGQSGMEDVHYQVQLPPEYDPYRKYPTLVVLNGANNSTLMEINYWAGMLEEAKVESREPKSQETKSQETKSPELRVQSPEPKSRESGEAGAEKSRPRRGQAMRHGYITIAVDWLRPHQYVYGYTGREHTAVLSSLRDAGRRLSIDTDRVYIAGHDIGGEAAWDMAQAHPDLWAGAIPIGARSDKYDNYYWQNAQYVPFCFISGELDGQIMSHNGSLLDKYLRERFDTTVVEYLGRGHDPFHDEIPHLFDWMGRRKRAPAPEEFSCSTMRPWDNFFWWIECGPFPEKLMMAPEAWRKRGARSAEVSGKMLGAERIGKSNRLAARSSASVTTIWLSPELVDFSKPIHVSLNGDKLSGRGQSIRPDLGVLLEDVRTRGDRLHPFWAKLESGAKSK